MKPTHFHTGVSGRIRFVTIYRKNGVYWTTDGYKANTTDLKSINEIIGIQVVLNGHIGHIVDVCASDNNEDLSRFNDLVLVYWESGTQPCWQPAHLLINC